MHFSFPNGSSTLTGAIIGTLLVGFVILFALLKAPPQARKPIVATVTFLCGLFYVLLWIFPAAQDYQPGDIPRNSIEWVSFRIQDAVPEVGNIASILSAFLLGLGAASLIRIHGIRLIKKQKDWFYSFVTLFAMATMCIIGYVARYQENHGPKDIDFSLQQNWTPAMGARDFLFDGLLQKMDSAMFSLIAFYILSAAYRAFRIRSVEATILLATAFVVMLSLLPMAAQMSNDIVNSMTHGDPNAFMANFKLSEITKFIQTAFQAPAIRGIDFGIGVGALAMGIRLWLSLDKQGSVN